MESLLSPKLVRAGPPHEVLVAPPKGARPGRADPGSHAPHHHPALCPPLTARRACRSFSRSLRMRCCSARSARRFSFEKEARPAGEWARAWGGGVIGGGADRGQGAQEPTGDSPCKTPPPWALGQLHPQRG